MPFTSVGTAADAIVELTETGRALRAAGLKVLDTIVVSYTELIANRAAYEDPDKRKAMEAALKAYEAAADYQVAEVTTAATFESAELYRQLGKDLISSERPKNLKKDELEQYDVLLEEQAFPFEEKAIKLHEVNAARTRDGTYDEWVQKSFSALAQLNPGRYGKVEIGEQQVESIR